MQNISIPPQINSPASHAITPVNADNASTNGQSNETFRKIMEQEVSNNTVTSQQDYNAASEAPAATVAIAATAMVTTPATMIEATATAIATASATAIAATTNNSENLRPVLTNPLQEKFSGKFTMATNTEAATFSLEANEPYVNNTDHLPINDQTRLSEIPTVTTTQITVPILSQPTPVQKFYANIAPGQPYDTANFAATNKIMPPSAEAISNNMSPLVEITTFSLTSDTAQSAATDNTPLLTASAPSPSAQSTPFTPTDMSLDAQLGQPKWEGEFAQKIVWLAGQQQQVAEIRLNPAHLGPIEIMLSITNDQGTQQATAQFLSSHLAVREAIEAALPKLREMMADNGITLGNVTVDANASQQQKDTWQQEHAAKKFAANQLGTHRESADQLETTTAISNHLGIVNTFA